MPADTPNNLEQRLADLEQQVRALRAGNLTQLASVVDASGNTVSLANLAFGQVVDVWNGVGIIQQSQQPGVTVGPASSAPASAWTYPGHPLVEVLVLSGRLRVDWSAMMACIAGTASSATSWSYSYAVDFIGAQGARGSVTQRVIDPSYYRAIVARDQPVAGTYNEVGNWAFHTGLTPGWYRVQGAWILAYNSTPSTSTMSSGFCDYPRLSATPF